SGKPMTLVVVEERDVSEDFLLTKLDAKELELYLRSTAASPALRKALEEALSRKSAVVDIAAKRASLERRVADLEHEQSRVQANLNAVPAINSNEPFAAPNKKLAGELLQRYLTKLA